jgi:glycosyltransferase involved in cell wall biosynthesis
LIEKIKEINPDIIHLHNLHGYYLNIIDLFKYLLIARKPVVWTLHDCWPMTGHCTFFDYIKCEKWMFLCSQCPQKKKYPASYFFDRSKRNYILKKELFTSIENMTIVPVSNWLSNIVKQSYLSKYQIKVINNGVDTAFFGGFRNTLVRNKFNFDNKFIILGVANIWDARKGLWDFVELSKLIDSNCLIVLVGLNSKEIRNLPVNIIGIARTENKKELAELYACADVFINPTYEDNFPTTNLEALASGTPVITYKTGGSVEAVSPDTGYVVEKGNIAQLMETINICQAFGKGKFSAACMERADKLYKKNDRYKDYLNLYSQMLKQEITLNK